MGVSGGVPGGASCLGCGVKVPPEIIHILSLVSP